MSPATVAIISQLDALGMACIVLVPDYKIITDISTSSGGISRSNSFLILSMYSAPGMFLMGNLLRRTCVCLLRVPSAKKQ